jgi:2,3-bisphosphoglycerate-independent phosphoglycerate mutase
MSAISLTLKLLYVLLDGVGDRPNERLGGATPLEAASTPSLDSLARRGVSGLVRTVGRGIAPESDVAVFHMLGYDLAGEYPGRGVVEAVGCGLDFRPGDLALRANFATVDDAFNIVDRRAGRDLSDPEGKALAAAITEGLKLSVPEASFRFVHTVAHRAVLHFRLSGGRLSGKISNTDPAYSRVGGMGVASGKGELGRPQPCLPLEESEEAKLSARLVNEFVERSKELLKAHPVNELRRKMGLKPANVILCRDAGSELPSISTLRQRFGRTFAAVADMPVELGIGILTGMDVRVSRGVFDYDDKLRSAKALLATHDVVYLHIKGPDEPGHDGEPEAKKRVIEEIDSRFFAPLTSSGLMEGTTVAVSADHSTPCSLKAHGDDPVPLLICGGAAPSDGTRRFTEAEAARGSLGTLMGVDVLPTALRYT